MSVGPWPAVRVESTDRAVTAYGGAVLLRDVMTVLRVVEEIDACVRVKERARGLSEGQLVSAMAESIALGATCLDDLAVNRADVAQGQLRGFAVPAPQTAGSFLRRFTLGHIHQLNKALVAIQHRAFVAAGVAEVTLDFDSTYVFSRSKRRQGVDRTYKKGYALHPLLCFDAASGAAVHARLRRGRSGPSTGIGTFVTEALRRVPEQVAVRARFDSGFYSGSLFDQLETAGVIYLCGVPLAPRVLEAVRVIPDTCFAACSDKDEGEVAEFGYRLAGGGPFRRYVVKRIEIEPGEQASLETGGYRYWIFATNDHHKSPAELESEHRHKADVEAGMRELKSNFGLGTIRKHGFMANWAWLLLVCLGHNLCRWVQQLGRLAPGRDGTEHRAKRLRYRFLVVPALVTRSGRRLSIKLPISYPNQAAFLRARHAILRHLAT